MSEQSQDQQSEQGQSAGAEHDTGATRGEEATAAGAQGAEVVDQAAASEHNRSNV